MKYVSTRRGLVATSAETIFQGLAPDGGLYVPEKCAFSASGRPVQNEKLAFIYRKRRIVQCNNSTKSLVDASHLQQVNHLPLWLFLYIII